MKLVRAGTTGSHRSVWLYTRFGGRRYAQFDVESGHVLANVRLDRDGGPVAGVGRSLSCGFTAYYLDPADRKLYVQSGRVRFRLDGYVRATHRWTRGGFMSNLRVVAPGGDTLELFDWVGPRRLIRRFDDGETAFGSGNRDFLFDLMDRINQADRRAAAFGGWNATGEP